MDPSALSKASSALEKSSDLLALWLGVWTTLVVIGLIMEYVPEVAKAFRKRPVEWATVRLLIGGVLITAGVAGELVVQFQLSKVETNLRTVSYAIEASLNKKVGDAGNAAAIAFGSAGAAIERASRADERAAKAEIEAARLNKLAERERLARVKIEERIRPRRLSPRQRVAIRAALSAYSGARVRISTVADDAESFNLGADIKDAVSLAGWQVAFFGPVAYLGPSASQLPSGVEIRVGGMLNAPAVALLRALRDQGIDVAIRLEEAEKSGDVIVIVGAKP